MGNSLMVKAMKRMRVNAEIVSRVGLETEILMFDRL